MRRLLGCCVPERDSAVLGESSGEGEAESWFGLLEPLMPPQSGRAVVARLGVLVRLVAVSQVESPTVL